MNSHVIPSQTIAKIKKLNIDIKGLRDCRDFTGLTPKQQIKLDNKENKLYKLLNQL
jgi:hypothetical protein